MPVLSRRGLWKTLSGVVEGECLGFHGKRDGTRFAANRTNPDRNCMVARMCKNHNCLASRTKVVEQVLHDETLLSGDWRMPGERYNIAGARKTCSHFNVLTEGQKKIVSCQGKSNQTRCQIGNWLSSPCGRAKRAREMPRGQSGVSPFLRRPYIPGRAGCAEPLRVYPA